MCKKNDVPPENEKLKSEDIQEEKKQQQGSEKPKQQEPPPPPKKEGKKNEEQESEKLQQNAEKSEKPQAEAASMTTLAQWMTKNQAAAYVGRFENEGYDDVSDLLPEVIKRVLQGEKPGIVDRLVRIRTEELQKPKPQALQAPVLKPGMELDLSAPALKGMDGVSLKLPDLGFAPGSDSKAAVVSAGSLTDEEWIALAMNSDMLMGLDLEAFFEGESSVPQECFAPALWWKVPDSREFFNCEHLSARINTEITYTAQSATMVSAGFTSVTASVTTPWVSASVSHEENYRKAQSSRKSTLYIVGMYDFDRVRVDLEQCTVVSPRFVSAVKNALADPRPKASLEMVFQKYGQIIGRQVTLGGRLFFIHAKEEMETAKVESLKSSTSVAVAGAYGAFGGSVGVASGTASETQESSLNMNEKINFQAIGGDVTLANEPEKWKDTIKSPAMWEVIRYDRLRYTYELLDEELQKDVLMYWERPMDLDGSPIVMPVPEVQTMKAPDGVFITGFKISFKHKVPGLSLRYWAASEDGKIKPEFVKEGEVCGTSEKGSSCLQELFIELTGGLARRYDLHYRVRRADDKFSEWVNDKEVCGVKGMKIRDIEVVVSPAGGGVITIPADSFIPDESRGMYDIGKYGPGIVCVNTPGEWLLTYHFEYMGQKPVRRRLQAEFASAESRPVKVEFNGEIINAAALEYGTGAWDSRGLRAARIGTVTLLPGMNTLKISRPGPWSPHMKEFRLVAEVIDIPATSFIGTTPLGKNNYGLGVIDTGAGGNSVSVPYEFTFTGKKPISLLLEGVYTAADRRPVEIVVNPDEDMPQTFSNVMAAVTGTWTKDGQRVETIGDVIVRPGKNTLMLRTKGNALPHIQEFRLVSKEPFFDFDPDAD